MMMFILKSMKLMKLMILILGLPFEESLLFGRCFMMFRMFQGSQSIPVSGRLTLEPPSFGRLPGTEDWVGIPPKNAV